MNFWVMNARGESIKKLISASVKNNSISIFEVF